MTMYHVLLAVLGMLLASSFALAQDKPNSDLATLQAENKKLRDSSAKLIEQNAALAKQLADTQAECKRLLNICKTAGISTTTKPAQDATASESPPAATNIDDLLGNIDKAAAEYDRVAKSQKNATGIERQEHRTELDKANDKLVNTVTEMFKDKTILVECVVDDITMGRDNKMAAIQLKGFKLTKRDHIGMTTPATVGLSVTLQQAKEIKKGDRVTIKGTLNFVNEKFTLTAWKYRLYLRNHFDSTLGELHYSSYTCTIKGKTYQPG